MKNQTERTIIQDLRYCSSPTKCEVELFATIRPASKYYYQGLDENKKPRAFKIEAIQQCDTHHIRMNNNNYRCQDLTFLVKGVEGDLIPLAGGMES
jgi:hypothetical protein